MFYSDFRAKPQNVRASHTIITRAIPDPDIQAEHTGKVPAFKLTQAEIRKIVEEIIG